MSDFLFKFSCFDCRVSFKRKATNKVEYFNAHLPETEIEQRCPNCGNRMAFMGRNFQSPTKNDTSSWKAAQLLWESGYRFVGSGFHNSPSLPRKKVEVENFIANNQEHHQKVAFASKWEQYK